MPDVFDCKWVLHFLAAKHSGPVAFSLCTDGLLFCLDQNQKSLKRFRFTENLFHFRATVKYTSTQPRTEIPLCVSVPGPLLARCKHGDFCRRLINDVF